MVHEPDGGNKIGKISAGPGGRAMEKAGFYEGGLYIYLYISIYIHKYAVGGKVYIGQLLQHQICIARPDKI